MHHWSFLGTLFAALSAHSRVDGLVPITSSRSTRTTRLQESVTNSVSESDEPVVITFVTGNKRKLREAQMIIDSSCAIPFELQARDLDLDELQSDNPEKVAAAKCRLAAKIVGGPVMIDDTSLCFEALGGMPGPYIKWFMDSCGSVGLVKMLHGFDNRRAFAQCSIAFSPGPGAEPCLFAGRTFGSIVSDFSELSGSGFGWDAIFVPDSTVPDSLPGTGNSTGGQSEKSQVALGSAANTLSFAQMPTEVKNGVSHRGRALRQFAVFLQENEDWVAGRAIVRKATPRSPKPSEYTFSFRRRRRMV